MAQELKAGDRVAMEDPTAATPVGALGTVTSVGHVSRPGVVFVRWDGGAELAHLEGQLRPVEGASVRLPIGCVECGSLWSHADDCERKAGG